MKSNLLYARRIAHMQIGKDLQLELLNWIDYSPSLLATKSKQTRLSKETEIFIASKSDTLNPKPSVISDQNQVVRKVFLIYIPNEFIHQ